MTNNITTDIVISNPTMYFQKINGSKENRPKINGTFPIVTFIINR